MYRDSYVDKPTQGGKSGLISWLESVRDCVCLCGQLNSDSNEIHLSLVSTATLSTPHASRLPPLPLIILSHRLSGNDREGTHTVYTPVQCLPLGYSYTSESNIEAYLSISATCVVSVLCIMRGALITLCSPLKRH